MADILVNPGNISLQATATARVNRIPPALLDPPGGLFPLRSAAYEVDEYRLLAGWPVPVPELDIDVEVLVTASGVVMNDRHGPTAITTNADMRWVADTNYYDQTSLRWTPIQSGSSPWETSPDHAPTLITDYEYRVGDERFHNMTALNFDSNTDDYMWTDLGLFMGGVYGYTVVMVLNPNSLYGNDDRYDDNALWGPPDTEGHWVNFTVRDQAIFMETDERRPQRGVSIGDQLSRNAPTYLALVVGRPQTSLYAAVGPSQMKVVSLVAGPRQVPLGTTYRLGGGPFARSASMDMALLDIGIYGYELTKSKVLAEFATLSSVYGGDG